MRKSLLKHYHATILLTISPDLLIKQGRHPGFCPLSALNEDKKAIAIIGKEVACLPRLASKFVLHLLIYIHLVLHLYSTMDLGKQPR